MLDFLLLFFINNLRTSPQDFTEEIKEKKERNSRYSEMKKVHTTEEVTTHTHISVNNHQGELHYSAYISITTIVDLNPKRRRLKLRSPTS